MLTALSSADRAAYSTPVLPAPPLSKTNHPNRLIGDVAWPRATPLTEAVGPLAGKFSILSLRTDKADVVVDLEVDMVRRVEEEDGRWSV